MVLLDLGSLRAPTSSGRTQVPVASSSTFLRGQSLAYIQRRPVVARAACLVVSAAEEGERLRLNNLAPQPGARRKHTRKGRGHAAGQGASCGFGMRGQNSRSGHGTRAGFEGGQMPLYRRLPKLRGIAGGMPAGVPRFVTINVGQLAAFKAEEEVSLETLQAKRILNVSGKEAKLPLKVLGNGDLVVPLTIKAEQFSASAREKIEAAGGSVVEVPKKVIWTKALGKERAAAKAEAAAAGKN